jgi:V/A-type H+-transporting ATPase subunit C
MFEDILGPYNLFLWVLVAGITIVVMGLISRPFLTQIAFSYPNAKFEAIGNPFIDEKELGNLVASKDLDAFKETLNSLKDYNVVGDDTFSIQKSLDAHFYETIEMMRKDSPKKMQGFYDIYLEKIDVYLIKNMLKKLILVEPEKEVERVILRTYYGVPTPVDVKDVEIESAFLPSTKELLGRLKDADREELPNILALYGFEKEEIETILGDKTDSITIDMTVDKHVIERFKKVEMPYNCEQAKQRYLGHMVDILNIKNILRAKQLGYDAKTCKKLFMGDGQEIAGWKFNELVEYESVSQVISALEGTSYFNVLKDSIERYNEERSVQVLENVLDGFLLKIIKDISLQYYLHLGPTLRFLVSKEFEIRNLKVIAKGIAEGLPSDVIKNFLITEKGV